MIMKKLVVMMTLVIGTTAFAQEKKTDRKRMSPAVKMEKLTKELDLTADQQAKLSDVFDRKKETLKARKTDRKVDRESRKAMFAERKAERAEFDNEVRSILTDAQVEKYDAKKAKMKEMRQEKFKKKGELRQARSEERRVGKECRTRWS